MCIGRPKKFAFSKPCLYSKNDIQSFFVIINPVEKITMPSTSVMQSLQTTGEMEIQKMLADERARCEQHKVNYLTLKEEHTRLQEEYLSLQREMKQTLEQSKQMKENSEGLLNKAYKILDEKQAEIDGLKAKLDAHNPEALRQKIQEEVEQHYKEWCEQLENEVDSYREKYNQLHYEHTVAKCQLQYSETEQKQILEEMRLKNEVEIRELQKERDTLLHKLNSEGERDGLRLRTLQRENAQLNLKVKGLLTEIEELHAQRERSSLQADNTSRTQARQLAEHVANIRSLESEKMTLQMQKEALQKELSTCTDDQKSLGVQLHSAKDEILKLKTQLEEVEHRATVDATNRQIEAVRKKAEVQRERDALSAEIANLKLDFDTVKEVAEKYKQTIAVKEEETQEKIHAACQKVWEQYHHINSEKGRLKSSLKELEKDKLERETVLQHEIDKVKQKLQVATEKNASLENELTLLKTKLEDSFNKSKTAKSIQEENFTLKDEVQHLRKENSELSVFQSELLQQREKLKSAAAELHKKLEIVTSESQKSKDFEHTSLVQQHMNIEQERQQYQRRIEELEKQIRDGHEKTTKEIQDLRNKSKKYARLVTKLREKLHLKSVQIEEMEMENEMLNKNVPAEVHSQLKRQLTDLQRRHEEFHQIMAATLSNVPLNDTHNDKFNIATGPEHSLKGPPLSSASHQDAVGNIELRALRNRLDQLEEQQRTQVKELEKFASNFFYPSRTKLKKDEIETSSGSDLDNL